MLEELKERFEQVRRDTQQSLERERAHEILESLRLFDQYWGGARKLVVLIEQVSAAYRKVLEVCKMLQNERC